MEENLIGIMQISEKCCGEQYFECCEGEQKFKPKFLQI
jgi:hypothetical protein